MKNFGENGAWVYPGTAEFFRVTPIISITGKATDFKYGQYVQRVHPNKSPLKILEKRERGITHEHKKTCNISEMVQDMTKVSMTD